MTLAFDLELKRPGYLDYTERRARAGKPPEALEETRGSVAVAGGRCNCNARSGGVPRLG